MSAPAAVAQGSRPAPDRDGIPASAPIGPNERFVALDAVRIHRLVGPAHVRATIGTVWLTVTGERDDHVLALGDAVALESGREAWVQALEGRAGVVVPDLAASWPRRASETLQLAWRRLAGGTA